MPTKRPETKRSKIAKMLIEEKWGKKYPMCVSSWKTTGQNYRHILNIQKE